MGVKLYFSKRKNRRRKIKKRRRMYSERRFDNYTKVFSTLLISVSSFFSYMNFYQNIKFISKKYYRLKLIYFFLFIQMDFKIIRKWLISNRYMHTCNKNFYKCTIISNFFKYSKVSNVLNAHRFNSRLYTYFWVNFNFYRLYILNKSDFAAFSENTLSYNNKLTCSNKNIHDCISAELIHIYSYAPANWYYINASIISGVLFFSNNFTYKSALVYYKLYNLLFLCG